MSAKKNTKNIDEECSEIKEDIEESKGKKLQRDISVQAHRYFVGKTKFLTDFKETEPSAKKYRVYENCGKTSDIPLYSNETDLIRFGDDKETYDAGNDTDEAETQFAKDFARIIHSHSFRRLQGKSQYPPEKMNSFAPDWLIL